MSELKGIVHIDEYLYRVPLAVAEEIERLHIGYEAQEKQLHNACDEIERLQKRNALLEDVAVAAEKAQGRAIRFDFELADALDKLREVGDDTD